MVRPTFLAAFGEQQLLVGPGVVHLLHMVEVVFAVPVKPGAPDKTRRLRVAEDRVGTLHHFVAVVVPDDDLDVAQTGPGQLRPQVVAHEIAFFFGAVAARVPSLRGGGLVLHRHAPHRHTFGFIRLDEADKTTRPGPGVLRQQGAAAVHLAVALHPRGRAPGRNQQLDGSRRHTQRRLNERQQRLAVAVDVEAVQLHVTRRGHVGVVAQ